MTSQTTGISLAEAKQFIGPLVGWPAEDVRQFVVVTVDQDGAAGFGASPGIKPADVPRVLRTMADGIEEAVRSDGAPS